MITITLVFKIQIYQSTLLKPTHFKIVADDFKISNEITVFSLHIYKMKFECTVSVARSQKIMAI